MLNLVSARQKQTCFTCTQRTQYPVMKHDGPCTVPNLADGCEMNVDVSATPDPARIQGLQIGKKMNSLLKRGAITGVQVPSRKEFKCSLCKKKYKLAEGLEKHRRSMHSTGNDFEVPPLRQEADSEVSVIKHACTICAKVFSAQDILEKHMYKRHPIKKQKRPPLSTAPTIFPVNVQNDLFEEDVCSQPPKPVSFNARGCFCAKFKDVVWRVQPTQTTDVGYLSEVYVVDFAEDSANVNEGSNEMPKQCVLQVFKGRVNKAKGSTRTKCYGTKVKGVHLQFDNDLNQGNKQEFWYAYNDMHTTYESAINSMGLAKAEIERTGDKIYIEHCSFKS